MCLVSFHSDSWGRHNTCTHTQWPGHSHKYNFCMDRTDREKTLFHGGFLPHSCLHSYLRKRNTTNFNLVKIAVYKNNGIIKIIWITRWMNIAKKKRLVKGSQIIRVNLKRSNGLIIHYPVCTCSKNYKSLY